MLFLAYRILKDEYTHNNFKSISKAQFPSLLKKMWTKDPTRTKTNIVKSFMKAGIFPFNPKSIDRSRILQNNTNVDKNTSNVSIGSADDNQTSTIHSLSSLQTTTSSITTSQQAIAVLDQVLEDTKSNSVVEDLNDRLDDAENDNNNNDDDEHLPSKAIFTSSMSNLSSKRNKVQSNKVIATKNHQSALLPQRKRTKRKLLSIIDFDASGEDGKNFNCIINFVNKNFLDDEGISSSISPSHESSLFQHEIQPRKPSSKQLQTTPPNQQKKKEYIQN